MQRTPTTLQSPLSAPTRSSGPHHERVADPWVYWCGWLLYRKLRSVISHHRLSLFCCAVHVVSCVRCVARLTRAAKKKKNGSSVIWSNGHDARFRIWWREFEPRRVHVHFFFRSTFFFGYYVRNPDTTDNTHSTRAVQGARYNQQARSLYTPAARQQSRKQLYRGAVVCPRCITAVVS